MKHVADSVKGPEYRYLGHFAKGKNLREGHNTNSIYEDPVEQGNRSRGQPEQETTSKSLPAHPKPKFGFTPTEKNQIQNMERGSGAASSSGADMTKERDI